MRCAPERHHAAASKRRGVYDSVDAGERLQVKRIVVKRCCWCLHHKRVVREIEHYLQLYGHQKYGQNDFSVLLRQGNISAPHIVQLLHCSLMCIIFSAWI